MTRAMSLGSGRLPDGMKALIALESSLVVLRKARLEQAALDLAAERRDPPGRTR